jgi:enamine deaminase RidA (YjgF/YER057c/UK114 family)
MPAAIGRIDALSLSQEGFHAVVGLEYLKIARIQRTGIPMNEFAEILANLAHSPIAKRAITNHGVLNEAYAYAKPSSFSRGMRIDLNGLVILLISGTASIDESGASVHIGDFRAQMRRTLANITGLLESEGCTWHDIVRTTCYLRDIDRDYDAFNEERTAFLKEQGLDPLPASTGIQAKLCRPELLVEIEAIAMFRTQKQSGEKQ